MNILPKIEQLREMKLVGKRITMSFAVNKTTELWRSFMPQRGRMLHPVDTTLYSVEVYPPGYFTVFSPDALFEKWAAVAVTDVDELPEGMDTLTIPAGLYAVFHYKGAANAGADLFRYIFTGWLPASDYVLDDRPHFAVMGELYKNNDPDSEEDLWIPVKPR